MVLEHETRKMLEGMCERKSAQSSGSTALDQSACIGFSNAMAGDAQFAELSNQGRILYLVTEGGELRTCKIPESVEEEPYRSLSRLL
jgi:hypothetical protein